MAQHGDLFRSYTIREKHERVNVKVKVCKTRKEKEGGEEEEGEIRTIGGRDLRSEKRFSRSKKTSSVHSLYNIIQLFL